MRALALAAALLAATPAAAQIQAVLNVQEGGTMQDGVVKGGTFHLRDRFTPGPEHVIHDYVMAFEGIGWESELVGYRLYVDERNVVDIYGKYDAAPVLHTIGQGFDDYQYPTAWGGDILKVNQSLGIGGVGLLRGGRATQLGPATYTAQVVENGPETAVAAVDAVGLREGGSLHATYALSRGSAVTQVTVKGQDVALPIVTGIVYHVGVEVLRSEPRAGAQWAYVATWGNQSLAKDGLGLALFYRVGDVVGPPSADGQSLYVQFIHRDQARYAFAARWSQEGRDIPGHEPIRDAAAFKVWLEATRTQLEAP